MRRLVACEAGMLSIIVWMNTTLNQCSIGANFVYLSILYFVSIISFLDGISEYLYFLSCVYVNCKE